MARLALSPGSVFAGYTVEGIAGRGGMGVVYRARDRALERTVALKVVAPELAGDARFRERFLRESRLAASLEHAHILPVHAAGEEGGALYLVTRFVEGEDLGARVRREGRVPPEEALRVVGEVAEALDAAHGRGLVHRDVKPSNVLLDLSGRAYLADFGLAKPAAAESGPTRTGELVGTLDYLAPEQIRGGAVDGRADQYALACVLYQCLTGAPPFVRESEAQLLWAHMQEAPPSLRQKRPELPPALDEVVRRALAKEPAERYQSCAEFVEAGSQALGLDGRAVARRRLRRGKLLLALGVILIAGTVAAAAVLATRDSGPGGLAIVARNSVAVIDPQTNEVVVQIPVGTFPTSVAVGEGAVWVLNADDRTVSRIDLATREERALAIGATPTDLAVGEGAVWVAHGFAGSVSRIDAGSTLVEEEITLPEPPPPRSDLVGSDVAVGLGSVWVTGAGLAESGTGRSAQPFVWRIDPQTNEVVASVRGAGGLSLAVDDDVWGASFWEISRIDPGTSRVTATIPFPTLVWDVAVGEGAVWAVGAALWRINQETASVEATIAVGGEAVAAGEGSLWVASGSTVVRVDPRTNGVVATIDLGGTSLARGVAVGEGYVWVTVG